MASQASILFVRHCRYVNSALTRFSLPLQHRHHCCLSCALLSRPAIATCLSSSFIPSFTCLSCESTKHTSCQKRPLRRDDASRGKVCSQSRCVRGASAQRAAVRRQFLGIAPSLHRPGSFLLRPLATYTGATSTAHSLQNITVEPSQLAPEAEKGRCQWSKGILKMWESRGESEQSHGELLQSLFPVDCLARKVLRCTILTLLFL